MISMTQVTLFGLKCLVFYAKLYRHVYFPWPQASKIDHLGAVVLNKTVSLSATYVTENSYWKMFITITMYFITS